MEFHPAHFTPHLKHLKLVVLNYFSKKLVMKDLMFFSDFTDFSATPEAAQNQDLNLRLLEGIVMPIIPIHKCIHVHLL